jgi:hypothetical protein
MSNAQNAETARHKIVEHTVGAGRFFACRCLCGWDGMAYHLEDLDALADAHIDGEVRP